MLPYVARLKESLYGDYTTPRTYYRDRIEGIIAQGAKRILDAGCGYAAPELERLSGKALFKVGIDLADGLAARRAPTSHLLQVDCDKLPFGESTFDLVISMSVLEHLEHPDGMFSEVARVLVSRGYFVFLTPNRWDYISICATLIPNRLHGTFVEKLTGRPEADTFPTQYRANSLPTLRRLAAKAGLELVEMAYLREHPHYLQRSRVLYTLGAIYEQAVERHVHRVRPWILGVLRKPSVSNAANNGEQS